jgi:apolipoprotein N-acyltransferase
MWGIMGLSDSKHLTGRNSIKVSLIQGNIPEEKKLYSRFNQEIFDIHEKLTRQAFKEHPDIIIWPETTILTYLTKDQNFLPKIKRLAIEGKAYLIIGTPHYDEKGTIYNSAIVFSPQGEMVSRYDKQKLVPFGEYLPFRPLFYPILKSTNLFYDDFVPGSKSTLLAVGKYKIGCMICFESTFTNIAKDLTKKGADFLLTITNDSWFEGSSALEDHLSAGVFRAVENRKYFIQVANSGNSAIIDPHGRILARTNEGQVGVLTYRIPVEVSTPSP